MSNRIWDGQCEDCYKRSPLRMCEGEILPQGTSAELCTVCIVERERDLAQGKVPRPIGIPADEEGMEWIELGNAVSYQNEADVAFHPVAVKFRFPTGEVSDQIGIIRFQLADGTQWFPAPALDFFVPNLRRNPGGYAASSVTSAIRNKLFPHAETKFDARAKRQ